MMRGGALIAAIALLAGPVGAQQASPELQRAPEVAPPPPEVRPMLAPRHPERARAETAKAVDIPQAAKDAGHNGRTTYTATVGPDSKLVALVLKESSMSPAIDEAVKVRAEKLYYFPATDKDGNKIEGTVDVSMSFAGYNSDSSGGGIEAYTCGDLVREWDWFTAANAARRKLFWPHNAYTSLASIGRIEQGDRLNRAQMLADRKVREDMWAKLIKRCRKKPERLMLTEVDQPEAYARLVNSF